MRNAREITEMWLARRQMRGGLIERMREVAALYDADIAVPMPELSRREVPMVANFFAQGIDAHGQRITSVMPDIDYPQLKLGTDSSLTLARTRRRANLSWWQRNDMRLILGKRARHLIAYSSAPVIIGPNPKNGCPTWEIRNPYDTFPSDDTMRPDNVIFSYRRKAVWLRSNYPDVLAFLNTNRGRNQPAIRDDDWIELVEYVDSEQRTLVATGAGARLGMTVEAEYNIGGTLLTNFPITAPGTGGYQFTVQLENAVNKAGCCPAIVPHRISLNHAKGQFDDARGLYQTMAKLMALDVHAVTNSVFPDVWFVHDGQGRIVKPADGLVGQIGEVENGTIAPLNAQPGFQTTPTIDRIERAIRLNTAQPAELGGESGTNIRTDRRGQSILSAAIDFYVQEHQDILARSLQHENEVAAEIDRAYYGKQKQSFYVSYNKDRGQVDYVPETLWAGPHPQFVEYAIAGMDANNLTVMIGQEQSLELISKRTARKQMPNIQDPEFEAGQVNVEAVEAALRSGIQQQAASGALGLPDIARLYQLLQSGEADDLADALQTVQQEAQARQASSGPPGTPEGPVQPGTPEAQPGISPGTGQEQPAVGPVAPSLENLRDILGIGSRVRGAANA